MPEVWKRQPRHLLPAQRRPHTAQAQNRARNGHTAAYLWNRQKEQKRMGDAQSSQTDKRLREGGSGYDDSRRSERGRWSRGKMTPARAPAAAGNGATAQTGPRAAIFTPAAPVGRGQGPTMSNSDRLFRDHLESGHFALPTPLCQCVKTAYSAVRSAACACSLVRAFGEHSLRLLPSLRLCQNANAGTCFHGSRPDSADPVA